MVRRRRRSSSTRPPTTRRTWPTTRRSAATCGPRAIETIAINPGVVPTPGYFGLADVVVTYEGPYAGYAAAQRATPAWVRDQPRERIAHLVYGATGKQAEAVVKADAYAGHVYVTDGVLPHPWGSLPPYLQDEERSLATCGE